jgi:hypothetical protein
VNRWPKGLANRLRKQADKLSKQAQSSIENLKWQDAKQLLDDAQQTIAERARNLTDHTRETAESSYERVSRNAQDTATKLKQYARKDTLNDAVESVTEKAKAFSDNVQESATQTIDDWFDETCPENWYRRTAKATEACSDAVLRDESGASAKIVRVIAGKLGVAGTSAGIFGLATILGTASTGTAISSLSGAAFTSAAAAWVGGSVVMGTAIIGVAAVAGGIGVALGAGLAWRKYAYGQKREKSELENQEQRIVDACLALATAFREQEAAGKSVDSHTADALYGEALRPLVDELYDVYEKTNSWNYLARQRLNKAIDTLSKLTDWLGRWSKKHPNMATGIVSAVFVKLFAENLPNFSGDELLVLDAIRRSRNDLNGASEEEIAAYLQSLNVSQLEGLRNNIKGIYHELRYADEENSDFDFYTVELFDKTNHPGVDVIITNTLTGETREVQLKATEYTSYIRKHNERYGDVEVFATVEVADKMDGVGSTGISNDELESDVEDVFQDARGLDDSAISSSVAVSGMIVLARNIKVLLRGEQLTAAQKDTMIRDGVVSASVSGLMAYLIG